MKNFTPFFNTELFHFEKPQSHFKEISTFLFVFFLSTIFSITTANSQTWEQLGPGADGQERAVYCYKNPTNGNYDFYVGSDVSGVWCALGVEADNINEPTQLKNL